jgi:hypothetical protein
MIFNVQYTAEVQATAVRLVLCDECEAEYVYQLERTTEGYGNSVYALDNAGAKRRATKQAEKALDRTMKSACDVIPCPECGYVQDHMLKQARFERAALFGLIGAGTLILAIGMLFVGAYTRLGNLAFAVAGLSFLATLGLGIFALVAYATHDPNRKPEADRIAKGQELAAGRKDFEKAFTDAAEQDFDKFCRKLGKKKSDGRFEMRVWADRGQVKAGDTIRPRLPDGERVTIRLPTDSRDGDEFPFDREVDGRPVQIVCVLNIYTKTKSEAR